MRPPLPRFTCPRTRALTTQRRHARNAAGFLLPAWIAGGHVMKLARHALGIADCMVEIGSPAIQIRDALHVEEAPHFPRVARRVRTYCLRLEPDQDIVQMAPSGERRSHFLANFGDPLAACLPATLGQRPIATKRVIAAHRIEAGNELRG